ncbi:MAG: hypothetical protein H0T42_11195 [Deltaproteobacteria bacterium]|nr:hypothetical protein [Deltaproteobacteria bacterium]
MHLITLIRTAVFASLAAGCTPRALPLAANHPANPDAEPGRLEGSPSPLRPGVAQLDEPPPRTTAPEPPHRHEETVQPPAPAVPDKPAAMKPAKRARKPAPAPTKPAPHPPGHEGHH